MRLPAYSVSKPAQADLVAIVRFTVERWGARQAVRYTQELEKGFQALAENPHIGRSADSVSPGLRRHELQKHVIFYRMKPRGIRIVRVLHQQMIPAKRHFEP
jgi:toxin ParE1/3/4